MKLLNTIKASTKVVGASLKKHSPEILLVTGIVGLIGAGVMACKASTKVEDILDDTSEDIAEVEGLAEEGTLAAEDVKKATTKIKLRTAGKLVKLYSPALIVASASIATLFASNRIMRKRTATLASSLAAVDTAYKKYQERVAAKIGVEEEKNLRYGVNKETIETKVTDENGKTTTKKEKVDILSNSLDTYSPNARFFDSSSREWEPDSEYNLSWLVKMQDVLTDKLRREKILSLNEVYKALDIKPSRLGQEYGWIYEDKDTVNPSPSFVDLGIFKSRERNAAFVNGYEDVILLDFNCVPIIHKIK